MLRHAIFFLGWSGLFAACHPLPEGRVEQALYTDVNRVIKSREDMHWGLDRVEVEAAASMSADAVCSTDATTREHLVSWLDGRIALDGQGPSLMRRMRRVRAVLEWWRDHESECASVEPSPEYIGIHGHRNQFALLIDAIASFNIFVRNDRVTMGPGLGIRVMPSWGHDRYTFAVGLETASLFEQRRDIVEGYSIVSSRVQANVPLLFRIHDLGSTYDFEVALSMQLRPNILPYMPPGGRVGFAYGNESLRNDAILKYLAYWLTYEVMPPRDGLPVEHIVRIGTRVGTDVTF